MVEVAITMCQLFACFVVVYGSMYAWFMPMNRVRTEEDNVGFAHISGKHKKNIINRLRKARKNGKIPPPFPNGWYAVVESRDVSRKVDNMVFRHASYQLSVYFRFGVERSSTWLLWDTILPSSGPLTTRCT